MEPIVVQKAATVEDIVADHIAGLGGYAIAEKYGLDTEKVKQIINDADQKLAFVPANEDGTKTAPVDAVIEPLVEPLEEGQDPDPKNPKGHK